MAKPLITFHKTFLFDVLLCFPNSPRRPTPKNLRSVNLHICFFTHISVFMLFHKQFFSIQMQGTIVNNSYTTKYVNKHITKNNIVIKEKTNRCIYWTSTQNITHFQQPPWNIYLLHLKWVWQTTVWKLCISGTFWEPVWMLTECTVCWDVMPCSLVCTRGHQTETELIFF